MLPAWGAGADSVSAAADDSPHPSPFGCRVGGVRSGSSSQSRVGSPKRSRVRPLESLDASIAVLVYRRHAALLAYEDEGQGPDHPPQPAGLSDGADQEDQPEEGDLDDQALDEIGPTTAHEHRLKIGLRLDAGSTRNFVLD